MYDCRNFIYILFLTLIKTMIIFLLVFMSYEIIIFNHSLGESIANVCKIPYDLSLTVTSMGFVNNVTVVFTSFEMLCIGYIIFCLREIRLLRRIFNCLH